MRGEADRLFAEERWLLDELCEEYLSCNSRKLAFLMLGCQGTPGVYTADVMLKAFTQMRKHYSLEFGDVMHLIEYRKKKLRGGTEAIAWIRNLVFHDDYFNDEIRKFLAKQAFMTVDRYLVDVGDDNAALEQMLEWYKSDIIFVRNIAKSGNLKARQIFYDMSSQVELTEYLSCGGRIEGCYSGDDDSFVKAKECREFMFLPEEIIYFDEQLLKWKNSDEVSAIIKEFGLHSALHTTLIKEAKYDEYLKACRLYLQD
jgi:hypothetical protein